MSKVITLGLALLVLMSTSGCAFREIVHANNAVRDKVRAGENVLPKGVDSSNRKPVEFLDGAYLGSKAIPVSRDKKLPNVFLKPLEYPATLLSSEGRVSLGAFAEYVTQYTVIPVEIDPNVHVRISDAGADAPGAARTAAQPARTGGSTLAYEDERNLQLNYYKGPLSKLLDMVAARLGISWEYENERIRFYRFRSQTFEVRALGGVKKISTSFSSTGQGSGGQGGAAQTVVGATQSQERVINYWESLGSSIKAMLSAGGKLVLNESASSVTVVDTPHVLSRVAAYIAEENRRAARSVHLRVEMYTLKTTRGDQLGADLTLALNKGKYLVGSTPVNSNVASIGAGGMLATVMGGDNRDSKLFLQALAERATVTGQVAVNAYTVNNHPVPFTMGATQSYIDSVGSSQGQTSTAITVTQKQLTTGVFVELLPHLMDNNRMLLQYVIDLSSDPDFTAIDTGQGPGLPKIQSPRIARKATAQTVNIGTGQTLVLTQMGREDGADKQSAGLTGASTTAALNKEVTIILITPILVDSEI